MTCIQGSKVTSFNLGQRYVKSIIHKSCRLQILRKSFIFRDSDFFPKQIMYFLHRFGCLCTFTHFQNAQFYTELFCYPASRVPPPPPPPHFGSNFSHAGASSARRVLFCKLIHYYGYIVERAFFYYPCLYNALTVDIVRFMCTESFFCKHFADFVGYESINQLSALLHSVFQRVKITPKVELN